MPLSDLMTQSFFLTRESTSIAEARSELLNHNYLVVTSNEGLPLTVVTIADLAGAHQGDLTAYLPKLPPTVIIGCDLDVSAIHDAPMQYLLKEQTRGATLLDDLGIVGVVPVEAIRVYLDQHPEKVDIVPPQIRHLRKALKERTLAFNFATHGGSGGPNSIRSLRVAGTLGGRRVLPAVPRVCKKCGWTDFYVFILPTTKCKNPDRTVQPQPWPHTLA